MNKQENSSGKPLANSDWLKNHHIAKLPERTAFAKKLVILKPKRIVDLGCATGLWLDLLNQLMPNDCEFIGIDSDYESIKIAENRSRKWERKTSYIQLDIEKDAKLIPPSDLTLAFNVFPYIRDLDSFLYILSSRIPQGILAVRQYDGAAIRFGPMETTIRQKMEIDLRIATENSQKFYHYDLDRVFSALHKSLYKHSDYEFELFERTSPFSEDFIPYYNQMLDWTAQNISEISAYNLEKWRKCNNKTSDNYFYEVDLVALLS
jgi:SAM-dependent methyltransferase